MKQYERVVSVLIHKIMKLLLIFRLAVDETTIMITLHGHKTFGCSNSAVQFLS